jgi:hypothetical protein
MLMITQILGYFELIVYIYIVCNRVFIELHDRTAHKASLLRRIFSQCTCFRDALALAFAMHLLSPTACEARKPTIRWCRLLASNFRPLPSPCIKGIRQSPIVSARGLQCTCSRRDPFDSEEVPAPSI